MSAVHLTELAGDAYKMQRLPGSHRVVINDDYLGIVVWNLAADYLITKLAFPHDYPASGIVDAWYINADGRYLLTINEAAKRAALFDLKEDGAAPVGLPLPPDVSAADLRYCWAEDLYLSLPTGFYQLRAGAQHVEFVEIERDRVFAKQPAWVTTMELLFGFARVVKVESDRTRLLYVYGRAPALVVGVALWSEPSRRREVAVSTSIDRFSVGASALYTMDEGRIISTTEDGHAHSVFTSPVGYEILDFDTIFPEDSPEVLYALCGPITQERHASLIGPLIAPPAQGGHDLHRF